MNEIIEITRIIMNEIRYPHRKIMNENCIPLNLTILPKSNL